MPASELLELAKTGSFDDFETRCLELLDTRALSVAQLGPAIGQLQKRGETERLANLTQMILENLDSDADQKAALQIACAVLVANPKNEELRKLTVGLYRAVYGDYMLFDNVLQASGLEGGRPVRMALKLLDLCLTLERGDTLISRMDDRVVEVTEIDRANGLFTLRDEGRTVTRPAQEVVREFERISADDFRVMRQLRPEKLAALIDEDPVAVAIGLIHAHGGHIDADLLKHELVPRYIENKNWSRWWTGAKNKLKRNPHVLMEGRSPIILSYNSEGQTYEEETWEVFTQQKNPSEWMATIESYVREKTALKEAPDEGLMQQFHGFLHSQAREVRSLRPDDALGAALVLMRLKDKGLPTTDEERVLAIELLRETKRPAQLLAALQPDALRELGLELLAEARPDDWVEAALKWLPTAPASLLDHLVGAALDAGETERVQAFADTALSDLPNHPEFVYWLWKGPKRKQGLKLPGDDELFRMILDTLSTLGRSVSAEAEVVKEFRQRTRAALALRDYAKVRKCMEKTSADAAIIIRRQLDRLEGVGPSAQSKMLDLLRDVHPQLWVVKRREVPPWDDPETLWVTGAGLAKRTAERDDIQNVKMRENAQRIGEAASHGDLSENSEYKFALEERDLLRARLAKANDEISRARVIEPHDVPTDYVGIGTRVSLKRVADGTIRTMTILGPFETDVEQAVYSYLAPAARKLLGKRPGERVYLTLSGEEIEHEITGLTSAVNHPD